MTAEGWKHALLLAVQQAEHGKPMTLDLLAQLLEEQDTAKEKLRRKGYGVTGTPWAQVVEEVPGA